MPMRAHLASHQWSGRPLENFDALAMLRSWHAETARLGFGYFRSGGGVLQTGTATLLRVTPDLLTLDTGGSRLAVMLAKARFQFGDLGFMTPDFRGTLGVQGLSFFLSNNDWMFLFSGADELDTSALTKHLETLLASR